VLVAGGESLRVVCVVYIGIVSCGFFWFVCLLIPQTCLLTPLSVLSFPTSSLSSHLISHCPLCFKKLTFSSEPNGGWAMPDGDDMPFPNLPNLNNHPPFRPNFRPGPPPPPWNLLDEHDPFDEVRMDHDRANGARRMNGAGAGVIPVIATAVLMALFS
jgi:hypothetical protein